MPFENNIGDDLLSTIIDPVGHMLCFTIRCFTVTKLVHIFFFSGVSPIAPEKVTGYPRELTGSWIYL